MGDLVYQNKWLEGNQIKRVRKIASHFPKHRAALICAGCRATGHPTHKVGSSISFTCSPSRNCTHVPLFPAEPSAQVSQVTKFLCLGFYLVRTSCKCHQLKHSAVTYHAWPITIMLPYSRTLFALTVGGTDALSPVHGAAAAAAKAKALWCYEAAQEAAHSCTLDMALFYIGGLRIWVIACPRTCTAHRRGTGEAEDGD